MKVFKSIEEFNINENTALALGTFDGLHIAHEHVIKQMVDVAKKNNLISVVYTFSNHPKEMNPSVETPKRLITPKQKAEHISELGVDVLIILPFDEKQISIEADDFLSDVIVNKLKAKHIVVGYDFRFGKNANGCVSLLESKSKEYGYTVDIVDQILYEGMTISSTMIRNYLLNGKVKHANDLLGRRYSIKGVVIEGKKMGRKLGFPTVNLQTNFEMSVLKPGVYITNAIISNERFYSVTNVGFNPTFDQKNFNVETHILGFDKDIYGETVEIEFFRYVREEVKFKDLDELVNQINQDLDVVKIYFDIIE